MIYINNFRVFVRLCVTLRREVCATFLSGCFGIIFTLETVIHANFVGKLSIVKKQTRTKNIHMRCKQLSI